MAVNPIDLVNQDNDQVLWPAIPSTPQPSSRPLPPEVVGGSGAVTGSSSGVIGPSVVSTGSYAGPPISSTPSASPDLQEPQVVRNQNSAAAVPLPERVADISPNETAANSVPTPPTSPSASPSPTAPGVPPVAALPAPVPAAIVISHLQQQVSDQAALLDEHFESIASLQPGANPVVTAVLATTTVVSASYFLIAGRVFSWMLTVFAARPVWTRFDPLQILFAWEEEQKRRAEQEESLRSLVKN